MNRLPVVLSALALFVLLAGAVGTASAATPGYAVYKVQASSQGSSYSLTVNETVRTVSVTQDELILKVVSGTWSFNYSRFVNSSLDVSPLIPAITNQTFSSTSAYGNSSLNILKSGTASLNFQGKSYQVADYSLNVQASANGTEIGVKGSLTTFPSGLIYSLELNASYPGLSSASLASLWGGLNSSSLSMAAELGPSLAAQGSSSLSFTLLSTSLPLNAGAASSAAQVASVGIGAVAAGTAIAVGLGVRHRAKSNAPTAETKPEHWAD